MNDRVRPPDLPAGPSPARLIQVLNDRSAVRSELIELSDGSRRVRKSSKGVTGPWGLNPVRAELLYLRALSPALAAHFPPLLAAWGEQAGSAEAGYERPYLDGWRDAYEWVGGVGMGQAIADQVQVDLALALLNHVHEPEPPRAVMASHMETVLRECLSTLEHDPTVGAVVRAEGLDLNGQRVAGPGHAFQVVVARGDLTRALAHGSCVRLHGDLTLENILWREEPPVGAPRLWLLDPVSDAGISHGTPMLDLVRYESSASGELFALRRGIVEANAITEGTGYRFRVRWEDPALRPFRTVDMHSRFRAAYLARHADVDRRLYRLAEAYFALILALQSSGVSRLAALLKATQALHLCAGVRK